MCVDHFERICNKHPLQTYCAFLICQLWEKVQEGGKCFQSINTETASVVKLQDGGFCAKIWAPLHP